MVYFKDGFLKHLHVNEESSQTLPIFLSKDVIRTLLTEYETNHGSAVTFVNQLKIFLAHHFTRSGTLFLRINSIAHASYYCAIYSTPSFFHLFYLYEGSFISLMNNHSFMELYGTHSEWFLIDSMARKRMINEIYALEGGDKRLPNTRKKTPMGSSSFEFFKSIQKAHGERMKSILLIKLLVALHEFMLLSSESSSEQGHMENIEKKKDFNVIEEYLLRSDRFKSICEVTLKNMQSASKQELITLFGSLIDITESFLAAEDKQEFFVSSTNERKKSQLSSMKGVTDVANFFHQCIVLLDCVDSDIEWDLRQWIAEKFCTLLFYQLFQRRRSELTLSPILSFGFQQSNGIDGKIINATPRRELALTLAKPTRNDISFTLDVKIAFNVFNSRIITLEEWFRRFTEYLTQVEKNSPNAITIRVQRFAFSLYQLMFCGLVIRSRRKDNVFEKGALVWAYT